MVASHRAPGHAELPKLGPWGTFGDYEFGGVNGNLSKADHVPLVDVGFRAPGTTFMWPVGSTRMIGFPPM